MTTLSSSHQYTLNKLLALYSQLNLQIAQQKNRMHVSNGDFITTVHDAILETLIEQLQRTQKEIEALIKQDEILHQQYRNLLTISGIGVKTAPTILYYLNSKKFATVNKFMAYAGLVPQIEQSETFAKLPKIL